MGVFQMGIPVEWMLGAMGMLIVLTWISLIFVYSRLRGFQRSYLSLQTLISGGTLDSLLRDALEHNRDLGASLERVDSRLKKVEHKLRLSCNHTGIIRFNAFDNMGSDLSFAIAFTNQEGDGLVLSSINSREESRVYAKPLAKGESSYPLSAEEKEAINKALGGSKL